MSSRRSTLSFRGCRMNYGFIEFWLIGFTEFAWCYWAYIGFDLTAQKDRPFDQKQKMLSTKEENNSFLRLVQKRSQTYFDWMVLWLMAATMMVTVRHKTSLVSTFDSLFFRHRLFHFMFLSLLFENFRNPSLWQVSASPTSPHGKGWTQDENKRVTVLFYLVFFHIWPPSPLFPTGLTRLVFIRYFAFLNSFFFSFYPCKTTSACHYKWPSLLIFREDFLLLSMSNSNPQWGATSKKKVK